MSPEAPSPLISVGLAVRNDPRARQALHRVGAGPGLHGPRARDLRQRLRRRHRRDAAGVRARRTARVSVAVNPVNIGSHENMNRVLELSRGTLFRWISADDWLEPHALSECVRALERHPDAVGVTSGFTIHTPGAAPRYEQYRGRVPDLAGRGAPLRAHAVVLPRRRREVRPGLRHLPSRAADALGPHPPVRAHRLAAERRAGAHGPDRPRPRAARPPHHATYPVGRRSRRVPAPAGPGPRASSSRRRRDGCTASSMRSRCGRPDRDAAAPVPARAAALLGPEIVRTNRMRLSDAARAHAARLMTARRVPGRREAPCDLTTGAGIVRAEGVGRLIDAV